MDVMEDKLKFDGRITRLIFPYGLLINGDGNTIYTVPYISIFTYIVGTFYFFPFKIVFFPGTDTNSFGSNKSRQLHSLNGLANLCLIHRIYPSLPIRFSIWTTSSNNSDVQSNRYWLHNGLPSNHICRGFCKWVSSSTANGTSRVAPLWTFREHILIADLGLWPTCWEMPM